MTLEQLDQVIENETDPDKKQALLDYRQQVYTAPSPKDDE